MELSIGQPVVHPTHGAGHIVEVLEQELVAGFKRYLVIEFLSQRLVMRVPQGKAEALGIRQVMSAQRVDRVLQALSAEPTGQLPEDFKERRGTLDEILRTGRPVKIAEAVRELTWRHREGHLTKADSRYLEQARSLLMGEMSLATPWSMDEAAAQIDRALATSPTARPDAYL